MLGAPLVTQEPNQHARAPRRLSLVRRLSLGSVAACVFPRQAHPGLCVACLGLWPCAALTSAGLAGILRVLA